MVLKPDFFQDQIKLFKFSKASKVFLAVKKSGIPFWDIIKLLFILPFTSTQNIGSVFSNKFAPDTVGQKDVYYRALANQKINWRNLLLLFVKRYIDLGCKFTQSSDDD